MATIRDVATRCGLSAMTVSAVLNDRKGEVSPATRKRVLKVVEEMGYQPNAIARGLTRRRMNTLGIVMAYGESLFLANHSYLNPVLDGIFAANRRSHQRTLVIAEDSWEDAYAQLPTYLDGHCDGLIFVLPTAPSEMFLKLQQRKFPFVVIGDDPPEPGIPLLDLDNVMAGYDATSYLIGRGHRRIGMLKGDELYRSSGQRLEGYQRALSEAGIKWDNKLLVQGKYTVDSGYAMAEAMMSPAFGDRPTALFCCDDSIALGAYRAITHCGLHVPDDVSIVGVNDDNLASEVKPGLTTIRQPLREYGRHAVDMVLSQVARTELQTEKVRVRGELVERGSVATNERRDASRSELLVHDT